MLKRTIILAAGGSGGHVFPAQALAESLIERGWTVFFVTDQRGERYANEFPKEVKKLVLNMSNPRGDAKFRLMRAFWSLSLSFIIILRFCLKVKATTIVGFGGYPSATSIAVAQILRVPSVLHEQNAILGRVNSIFQKRVNLLVFGITPKSKVNRKGPTLLLGNPIRQSVLAVTPVDYSQLPSESLSIMVMGGSQGANFVSSLACNAIVELPEEMRRKITVFHQCPQEYVAEINSKYRAFNIKVEIKSFFTDISFHLNKAHLIISRSGASSLAEFCIFGRPSILIPLPSAVRDHQTLNATVMQESGASVVFPQNSVTSNLLGDSISHILNNFTIRNNMARAAKKMSRPDAACKFVDELENLI